MKHLDRAIADIKAPTPAEYFEKGYKELYNYIGALMGQISRYETGLVYCDTLLGPCMREHITQISFGSILCSKRLCIVANIHGNYICDMYVYDSESSGRTQIRSEQHLVDIVAGFMVRNRLDNLRRKHRFSFFYWDVGIRAAPKSFILKERTLR